MQVKPFRIISDKKGTTLETGVLGFGICNRRRMLLGGDIPKGITKMPRSGP